MDLPPRHGPLVGALVGVVALTWASPAAAYIDPGSGSLIIQLLLAGIAGVAVVARLFWHRVLALFGRAPRPDELDEGEPEEGPVTPGPGEPPSSGPTDSPR